MLGLAVWTTPVLWVSGDAQVAYNVAFLLTFVLSRSVAMRSGGS